MGETEGVGVLSDAAGGSAAHPNAARSALNLARDKRGTTAIEYAIIAGAIAVAIIGGVTALGLKTADLYQVVFASF
jgi:Flp pilus assembly pilin Flp